MPRRDFKTPFAVSGDQSPIPTEIQANGSVSIIQGYGPDYQRPTDGSDPLAKIIERDKFNSLMNDVTASIGEIQQNGFPIWSSGMAPYPSEAWVRHQGKVWRNSLANNTAEPGTSGSGWIDPSSGGVQRFTANGSFVVPAGVTTVYVSGAGGGGGGGGGGGSSSSDYSGGGGGGGAGRSTIKQAVTVTPGDTIVVAIGTGGNPGSSSTTTGSAGSAGGQTTFGSLITLAGGTGGSGGNGSSGSGGAGGTPGGQWGGDAQIANTGGNGGSGGSGPFGTGGGGGRAGQGTGTVSPGTPAFGYGVGGAGGGGNYSTVSGRQGGAGTAGMPGILIVEW